MGHQKGKRRKMENMKQHIFSYLPSEIITEILSRLPVQTIVKWKRVCKSWHHLFETDEFVKSHHSKSLVSGNLFEFEIRDFVKSHDSNPLVFEDALTLKYDEKDKIIDDLHVNTIKKFYFNYDHTLYIQGSIDGFLLLAKYEYEDLKVKLRLCNPITREYIDLLHSYQSVDPLKLSLSCYGFGVSKITRQYKVVGIFRQRLAEVYTLGSGSWRSVAPHANVHYTKICRGEFVNGNLHWLVDGLLDDVFVFNGKTWISCFNLETETFSAFSPPPQNERSRGLSIDVVENTLCVTDLTYGNYATQVIIWMMKDYEVEKSWTKQFIVGRNIDIWNNPEVYPIRFSKDGVILMCCNNSLYYYSNKTKKTTKATCNFQGKVHSSHSYTPSFLSLKCFKMENVLSL